VLLHRIGQKAAGLERTADLTHQTTVCETAVPPHQRTGFWE
jgi:hypothetical protein